MKKLLALVLAVMMVLSCSVTAFAEGTPSLKFNVEPFTAEGEVKDVELVAENVGAVSMIQFTIEYDAEKLELQGYVVADAIKSACLVNANTAGKIILVYDDINPANIDGVVLTMTFKAISDELGNTTIGFKDDADFIFYDGDYSEVIVEEDEESGEVPIDYVHEHTFGEWAESKVATCSEQGEEKRTCTAYNGTCDEFETQKTEINPANHADYATEVKGAKEATCTEKGYTGDTYCLGCNKVKAYGKEISEAADNHADHGTVTKGAKEATCTEKGYTGDIHCEGCDVLLEKGEDIEMIPHVGGTATCMNKAVCEKCGNAYGEKDPSNHVDEEPILVDYKAPSCTEYGYSGDKFCLCGVKLEEGTRIDMLPHVGGKANCESGAICTECGNEYSEKDPDNHVAKVPVIKNFKAASCVEGYTGDSYCAGCDVLLEEGEVTPAIGEHAGGTATCTNKAICDGCGNEYGEKDPSNHGDHETELKNQKTATCTEKGYSGDTYCKGCDELVKAGEETPMKPHTGGVANCQKPAVCNVCKNEYGSVNPDNHVGVATTKDAKEPTCEEEGYTGDGYCGCGELIEKGEAISALGHKDTNKDHTCDNGCGKEDMGEHADGNHDHKCDYCKAVMTFCADSLVHTEAKEQNCTEKGNSEYYTCSVCGKYYSDAEAETEIKKDSWVIKENGHTWGEWEYEKEPTCTEGGKRTHYCTAEGCEEDESEELKALGHDFGKWFVVKEATYDADGLERRECSRCEHFEENVIKKINHEPTVIIDMNGKTEHETNPNTGASVLGIAAVVAVGAAAAVTGSKKNNK